MLLSKAEEDLDDVWVVHSHNTGVPDKINHRGAYRR